MGVAGSSSRVCQGPWAVQSPVLQSKITGTHNSLLLVRVELVMLIPSPVWEQYVLHFWSGAGTQPLPTESFGQADGQWVQCFCSTTQDPSKDLMGRNCPLHKKNMFVPRSKLPQDCPWDDHSKTEVIMNGIVLEESFFHSCSPLWLQRAVLTPWTPGIPHPLGTPRSQARGR